MQASLVLRKLLDELPVRLAKLPSDRITQKPAPDRWSAKEELGHLLDSAANNHQRIVRAQMQSGLAMPGYEGDVWVRMHRYQDRNWDHLIETWEALNEQLLIAAQAVPEAAWVNTCTIHGSAPVSLRFVYEDYVHHMLHHLRHIGVETDDLLSAMPSLRNPWKPWPGGKPPAQER
jgi:hypothetical protein